MLRATTRTLASVPHRCRIYGQATASIRVSIARSHQPRDHPTPSCPTDSCIEGSELVLRWIEWHICLPQPKQPLTVNFLGFHDRVGMHLCYPSPFSWAVVVGVEPVPEEPGCTSKQELFIDLHELVRPKLILIKDIRREKLRCDPAGKVLDSFAISRVSKHLAQ